LEHWRIYLAGGQQVTVITDHISLVNFDSQELRSGRLARWAERLQDFNIKVVYRRGDLNVADGLSRATPMEVDVGRESTTAAVAPVRANTGAAAAALAALAAGADSIPVTLRQRFEGDAYFLHVLHGMYDPEVRRVETSSWRRRLERFVVQEGELYMSAEDGRLLRCVPSSQRTATLHQYHNTPEAGHAGISKMYATMRETVFWPRMVESVARYVKQCDSCQRNKSAHRTAHAAVQPLAHPQRPWETIAIDFMDLPLSTSGHDAVLTVSDCFSNYIHFIPTTRTVSAADTVDLLLQEVVRLHGVPKGIVSDRDPRFTSELWQALCSRIGITTSMTTAHRPQADGRSERANRTVQTVLRHFCNVAGTDWDQPHIRAMVELGINYRVNPTTGVSPFQACQGHQPLIPATISSPQPSMPQPTATSVLGRFEDLAEIWQQVNNAVSDAQERMKQQAVTSAVGPAVGVGDLVLLNTSSYTGMRTSKLHAPFIGPFRVLATPSPATLTLELPAHIRIHPTVNVDRVKPYTRDPNAPPAPGPVGTSRSGEPLYALEKIMQRRKHRGRVQYKVRWRGYGPEEDSWVPEQEVKKFHILLREFEETLPAPRQARNHPPPKRRRRGEGGIV
jgi:transposase InsO family protein